MTTPLKVGDLLKFKKVSGVMPPIGTLARVVVVKTGARSFHELTSEDHGTLSVVYLDGYDPGYLNEDGSDDYCLYGWEEFWDKLI